MDGWVKQLKNNELRPHVNFTQGQRSGIIVLEIFWAVFAKINIIKQFIWLGLFWFVHYGLKWKKK